MNTLDLTKNGGFPFSQDMLDWMQQNALAVLNMLGAKLLPDSLATTANTPVGLVGINPNGTSIYKAGWMWYNNEIFHFPADIDTNGLPALTGGLVYGFAVQETDTNITYNDGSTHGSKISRTMTIASGANAISATFIPLTTKVYYFDNGLREVVETHIAMAGATGIAGDVYYRKNYLANTLQLRINATITSASISDPPQYQIVATLPVGYRPSTTIPITLFVRYHTLNYILDTGGDDHILHINAEVNSDGTIEIGAIKGASNYSVSYFGMIPLD